MTRSGRRPVMAISKASVTNGVARSSRMDHTDYPPRPDIDHRRQVEKPCLGRDIRDIRHPDSVRPISGELSAHQIGGRSLGRVPPGSGNLAAAVNPLDMGLSHEPGHPLATNGHTLGSQLSVDTRHPISAPRPNMDIHYPVPQCPVGLLPVRWATPQACVVAAGRAHTADHTCAAPDSRPGWLSRTQTLPRGRSELFSANQAAAFAKISFSSRRIRFSRRK